MRDITPTLRLQHYDMPAMDKAHHRFTALLGALPLVSRQALPCLFGNLIRTVREHCDQEERFMLATDYKGYNNHRTQHQLLLSTLEHHQHQLELGMELDPLDIHTLLCSWQDEHQQRWDDPLASHLRHATCWKTSQRATAAA